MSFKHSTFFFDYKSYKDELSSLSKELDKGNNSHLSLLVRNIRRNRRGSGGLDTK